MADWEVEIFEGGEHPRMKSPTGFLFEFYDNKELASSAIKVLQKQEFLTLNKDRVGLSGESALIVIDCDRWVNGDFGEGDYICEATDFLVVAIKTLWRISETSDSLV